MNKILLNHLNLSEIKTKIAYLKKIAKFSLYLQSHIVTIFFYILINYSKILSKMIAKTIKKISFFKTHTMFSSSKSIITVHSDDASKAIGPYSQGKIIKFNANLLFLSAQRGTDPITGNLISDDVVEQTKRCMENFRVVLMAGNSSFEHIVKATVYLTDMVDFTRMNEEYSKYFTLEPPASVCFEVNGLPKNAKVEIEFTAITND